MAAVSAACCMRCIRNVELSAARRATCAGDCCSGMAQAATAAVAADVVLVFMLI